MKEIANSLKERKNHKNIIQRETMHIEVVFKKKIKIIVYMKAKIGEIVLQVQEKKFLELCLRLHLAISRVKRLNLASNLGIHLSTRSRSTQGSSSEEIAWNYLLKRLHYAKGAID